MVAGVGCMPTFDDEIHLAEIKQLLDDEDKRTANNMRACRFEMSGSMHDFVAYQEIPNFGTQFYYAFSAGETVNEWIPPEPIIE